jgi:hypothetical protein
MRTPPAHHDRHLELASNACHCSTGPAMHEVEFKILRQLLSTGFPQSAAS